MTAAPRTLTQRIHDDLISDGKMKSTVRSHHDRLISARPEPHARPAADHRPWHGSLAKKPWDYRVTAVIPHRNTLEHLKLCLEFVQAQTERPYVMIIDTGSDEATLPEVLALRSDNVEVHQIACHGTEEYADVVCYAMDLAMSACRTEYLWCLHSDCFVTNRGLLAELLSTVDGGKQPVIGYESTSANKHAECKGMVSHTCTLLHMPTMHELDVTWSRTRLATQAKAGGRDVVFDPEMALNYRLRDRGVTPLILGPEQTSGIERDVNRVHLRSATLGEQVVANSSNARAACESVVAELRRATDTPPAQRPRETTTLNLIYHITPFASNDTWLRNVRQLLRRMDLFNGKRVIAIATGHNMVTTETVKAAFNGQRAKFLLFENNPALRETASTVSLLEAVESTRTDEATFYAHAKGVSTAGDPLGVTYWRNAMYHELLDYPEKIRHLLVEFPMVGSFRRRFGTFPDGTPGGAWHFGGTFFWFRNDAIFSNPHWRDRLPMTGWGTEAFPGILYGYNEVASVFGDDIHNPYDPVEYADPIDDDETVPAQTDALKIELGGGQKPKDGYLNVDRCEMADIRADFDSQGFRLPFDDDSVLDVYSAHCLEHVRNLHNIMREIVRVCRIGARIEIRVPHWNSSMAMCFDHKHTIAEPQVDHWCNAAVEFWFGGMAKRLRLFHTKYVPSGCFQQAKQLHPSWTDDQVLRFVPDACHEIEYVMHVIGMNA